MMNLDAKYRILITGSRGKSTLVRLLFAGMPAQGMNAYGRITAYSRGSFRAAAKMNGKQVFGCGNIAGTPLELLQPLIKERCEWTMPDA